MRRGRRKGGYGAGVRDRGRASLGRIWLHPACPLHCSACTERPTGKREEAPEAVTPAGEAPGLAGPWNPTNPSTAQGTKPGVTEGPTPVLHPHTDLTSLEPVTLVTSLPFPCVCSVGGSAGPKAPLGSLQAARPLARSLGPPSLASEAKAPPAQRVGLAPLRLPRSRLPSLS